MSGGFNVESPSISCCLTDPTDDFNVPASRSFSSGNHAMQTP